MRNQRCWFIRLSYSKAIRSLPVIPVGHGLEAVMAAVAAMAAVVTEAVAAAMAAGNRHRGMAKANLACTQGRESLLSLP
ncbi:hypothetical protein [Cohnella sp. AR92]|uniref:hypothetical protein n=1 Tax=Cohnella sp. AR92 TaxID=648716 RepID=UPI0018650295|nr:hypothetical protein [Cohnella sp. AR92]